MHVHNACVWKMVCQFIYVASKSKIKRQERPAGSDNFIVLIVHLFS